MHRRRRLEPTSVDAPSPWPLGWAIGGGVVALAAGLLLTAIALAKRIARQAGEIEAAIDGARENTGALFDLATTNLALDQTVRQVRAVRESE